MKTGEIYYFGNGVEYLVIDVTNRKATLKPLKTNKLLRYVQIKWFFMKNIIKEEWPAILASLAIGLLLTVAIELIVNNWEYIKATLL